MRHPASTSPADVGVPARPPGRGGDADAPSSGLWPDDDQAALLRFVLARDDDRDGESPAVDGWLTRVTASVERDPRVRYLLPMVHRTLERRCPDHPALAGLRTQRVAFVSRVVQQRAAWRPLLEAMTEAEAGPVLLKGVSLGDGYYSHPALRPASDIDILVPVARVGAADAALHASGWRRDASDHDSADVRFEHAAPYSRAERPYADVDLHVHVLSKCHAPSIDRWFAERTEPFDFDGLSLTRLDPTALLVHTLLHGLRWSRYTPIRWIIDATLVLRARGAEIDWQVLLSFVEREGFARRVSLALSHLEREYAVGVPGPVLERLAAHVPGPFERFENALLFEPFPRGASGPVRLRRLLRQTVWRAVRLGGGARTPLDLLRVARHLAGGDGVVAAIRRTVGFGKRSR